MFRAYFRVLHVLVRGHTGRGHAGMRRYTKSVRPISGPVLAQ